MKDKKDIIKSLPVKKADILLAIILCMTGIVLMIAGRFYDKSSGALRVCVFQDGVLVFEAPVESRVRKEFITPDGLGKNVLVIDDKKVYVESSDCPGSDCIKRGIIFRSGEEIICLPHRLVIRIEGGESIDAVAD